MDALHERSALTPGARFGALERHAEPSICLLRRETSRAPRCGPSGSTPTGALGHPPCCGEWNRMRRIGSALPRLSTAQLRCISGRDRSIQPRCTSVFSRSPDFKRRLVLEVGCATGKATLPLARVGFRITALEPGAALAAAARANVVGYDVDVVEARFEDWEPNGAVFDLVFAATAWHWVDAEVRYPKAAAVLRPHGSGGVGRRACDPPRRGPVLRRDPGDLRGDWGGAPCQLR